MLTSEQLSIRKTGIGGSDVAAIMGVSKYRTPLDVYLDKTSPDISVKENPVFKRGSMLEPLIRQIFAENMICNVDVTDETFRHPEHDYMIANVDGIIHDRTGDSILEIKTSSVYTNNFEGEIPQDYLLQVQHYMNVCGANKAYLAVLVATPKEFKEIMECIEDYGHDTAIEIWGKFIWQNTKRIEIDRDEDAQKDVQKELHHFWENHVKAEVPPPAKTGEDMRKLYPKCTPGKELMADDMSLFLFSEYEKLKTFYSATMDEYEKLLNGLERDIMKAMKDSQYLIDEQGNRLISWNMIEKKSLDIEKLKQTHPEIYHACCSKKSSRVFSLRAKSK